MNIKDNSARATNLVKVFWALVVMNLIAIISGFFELELLNRIANGSFTEQEANGNDIRQGIIGFIQTGLIIATIVMFLNWFRRGYANIDRAGLDTEENDSWTIWGFVVPIISLYKPYKMMREMVDKMKAQIANSDLSYENTGTSIIGWWWTLFIISNYAANLVLRLAFRDNETLEDYIHLSQVNLASDVIDTIAAVLTIFMIQKVSSIETSFSSALSSEKSIVEQFGEKDQDINTENEESRLS